MSNSETPISSQENPLLRSPVEPSNALARRTFLKRAGGAALACTTWQTSIQNAWGEIHNPHGLEGDLKQIVWGLFVTKTPEMMNTQHVERIGPTGQWRAKRYPAVKVSADREWRMEAYFKGRGSDMTPPESRNGVRRVEFAGSMDLSLRKKKQLSLRGGYADFDKLSINHSWIGVIDRATGVVTCDWSDIELKKAKQSDRTYGDGVIEVSAGVVSLQGKLIFKNATTNQVPVVPRASSVSWNTTRDGIASQFAFGWEVYRRKFLVTWNADGTEKSREILGEDQIAPSQLWDSLVKPREEVQPAKKP